MSNEYVFEMKDITKAFGRNIVLDGDVYKRQGVQNADADQYEQQPVAPKPVVDDGQYV